MIKKIGLVCTLSTTLFCAAASANTLTSGGIHYLHATPKSQMVIKGADGEGNIIISNYCDQTDNVTITEASNSNTYSAVACPSSNYPDAAACYSEYYPATNNIEIGYPQDVPYVTVFAVDQATGTPVMANQQIPWGQDVNIPCDSAAIKANKK